MTEKKPFHQESVFGMLRRTALFIGELLLSPLRSPDEQHRKK